MSTLVALDSQKHQSLKLTTDKSFAHAKTRHLLPVAVHEFAMAATHLPIVFVKDGDTGQFRACALTGLKPEQNLFWKDGGWLGAYVPESLRHYPLVALKVSEGGDSFAICIDEASPLVGRETGEALFDGANASEFLNRRSEAAVAWAQKNLITQSFIQRLIELKLLQSQSLSIRLNSGAPYELTGCYVIDEAALNRLDDQAFIGLKHGGYLAPIYAALLSLNQVQSLVRLAQ
ncbi:SapC family protein [Shewanella salipaludis]|uniref:SapC family protein n=1 Tax=Shewanella salipaludis TaxID=2723052 RepID=A0A972JJ48_9GAMM|nr:SapC family protein [Shewanella salipaludis]NMH64730.1 SapC family protein [Shewanella salipaludis]